MQGTGFAETPFIGLKAQFPGFDFRIQKQIRKRDKHPFCLKRGARLLDDILKYIIAVKFGYFCPNFLISLSKIFTGILTETGVYNRIKIC